MHGIELARLAGAECPKSLQQVLGLDGIDGAAPELEGQHRAGPVVAIAGKAPQRLETTVRLAKPMVGPGD
jgi:hypothetical protein